MTNSNIDIKRYCKYKKVRLYELADKLGITESTLSKKLRKELPNEAKQEMYIIIDRLAVELFEKRNNYDFISNKDN